MNVVIESLEAKAISDFLLDIVGRKTNMPGEVQVLKHQESTKANSDPPIVRVGAYCRVSTDMEDQLSSLELQMQVFRSQIALHPGWELLDVYADSGVSGTQAAKRPEFQRMVTDCREGRVDYIITKSISRFARNTVECLSYIRELQSYGTQILFEKEGIDTGTPFSEMLLTIMAAFAQEESRSISENTKWGIRKRFEAGNAHMPRLLGYEVVDNQLVIVPEEAETVRRIFDLYETGCYSFRDIAEKMKEEGRLTIHGSTNWVSNGIYMIVTNEKYVGDLLLQKRYTEDHITHRKVKNRDRKVPQYYIPDNHDPIISRKQFERCNRISALKNSRGKAAQYPYGDLLVCPICGHRLIRHAVNGHHRGMKGWHCDRDEDSCRGFIVRDKLLDKTVLQAFSALDVKAISDPALATFRKHHARMKTVDFYWLDEYVDRITFGGMWTPAGGYTLTIHWKCGVQTSVKMTVSNDSFDPMKLAKMTMQQMPTQHSQQKGRTAGSGATIPAGKRHCYNNMNTVGL